MSSGSEHGRNKCRSARKLHFPLVLPVLVTVCMLVSTFETSGAVAAFRGSTWSATVTTELGFTNKNHCGHESAPRQSWSGSSGIARLRGSTFATDCATRYGSGLVPGQAKIVQTVNVSVPVSLLTGKGGVNVSWSIRVSGNASDAINGSLNPVHCPPIYQRWNTNLGYTWVNVTRESYICGAITSIGVLGSALIVDKTTNRTFFPSKAWGGLIAGSGRINETGKSVTNYSNSSYWKRNSTATAYLNRSWGTYGSITGSYKPEWFINGTFNASDSYILVVSISIFQTSFYFSTSPGYATTQIDMARGTNGATLVPPVIW